MASEVIYVTIESPSIETVPTTVGGSPTNVVDVDVVGDYNDVLALINDLKNNLVPVGTIISGGWANEPPNYKFLNGQTITDGATLHPSIASQYPSWVSGNDLILPDMNGAYLLGASSTTGAITGSMSLTIGANNLPVHTHANTFAVSSQSTDHVHYLTGTYGGWAATAAHAHTHPLSASPGNSWDGWVYHKSSYTGTGANYQTVAADTYTEIYWTSSGDTGAASTSALSGYTSGAHNAAGQSHSHSLTGSVGNNTTTGTAIDLSGRRLPIKFAVKI